MLTEKQIKKLEDLVNYAMEDYRALLAAHGDPPGSVVDVVKQRHFDALRDLLRSFNTEPSLAERAREIRDKNAWMPFGKDAGSVDSTLIHKLNKLCDHVEALSAAVDELREKL